MATYPSFFVGQRLTATLLASMLPDVAIKPSNTTRTSTTSRTADPDLTWTVEANALYMLDYFFVLSCAGTGVGFSMSWTIPSGSVGYHGFTGLQHVATTTPTATTQDINATFDLTVGGGPGIIPSGTVAKSSVRGSAYLDTAATAGSLTLTWAQLASSASGTTLEAGSWGSLKRVS